MFRQVSTVAVVVLTALGSFACATAQESKEAGGRKEGPPKIQPGPAQTVELAARDAGLRLTVQDSKSGEGIPAAKVQLVGPNAAPKEIQADRAGVVDFARSRRAPIG